jgi:lipopolysaccharide export system protein LptA
LAALWLGMLATLPAAAQQPVLPGLSGQDRKAPIEITADQLVVEQTQRTATFKGEVEATQGTMRLTADRLVVHYGQDQPQAATAAGESGSIRRIEAFGRVLVRAPGETAEGERGVYDVAAGTLSLEGSVVLTRAGNVVRGERLEVDLASGRSTLLAAPGQGPAGRVRALFQPGGGKGS